MRGWGVTRCQRANTAELASNGTRAGTAGLGRQWRLRSLVVELTPLREAVGGLYTRVLAEVADSGQN